MNDIKEYKYLDEAFYKSVKEVLEQSRKRIYRNIQSEMVLTYWQIGKMIVEKQGGESRAKYGDGLIKELSIQMTKDFGKGFTISNVKYMRQFYLAFQKSHTLCGQLSWSHYRLILSLEDENARNFYIQEAIDGNWSVRQLQREIHTFSYQRYLASKCNHDVVDDTAKKEPSFDPKEIIKDPYVLEFAGLKPDSSFYESDLEQALITHLNEFLLELGSGFAFVARQRRFDMDGRNFYVDLVLYNYKLKCFVLIDLKRGDLTHQDIGQMQMYVNYYTRELMEPGDNPPIGIILSTDKSDTLVKYTLPLDNKQIYASKYMLYLPKEEELQNEMNKQIRLFNEREKNK
ncbi:MAG: PDDEXK nuclease domain-containing protein [Bacilli bacterium]|nr:PDDEXK nuclease domain-containing protein [Bacilli bacterium]